MTVAALSGSRLFAESPQTPAVSAPKWQYSELTYNSNDTLSFQSHPQYLSAGDWAELAKKMQIAVVGSDPSRSAILNALGAQGWELVSATPALRGLAPSDSSAINSWTWTFKRPIR
jgi:hypothetical protein